MQDTGILVRPTRADDFLPIAELDRNAWKSNANSAFIPDGEHVWRIWCEHAATFVACEGNEILGAAVAFPCTTDRYCVHKLMVAATARGKGVGTKLFAALLEYLDEVGADAFLTVDPANTNAIKLYEKLGFTEREFVEGYYRPEEDRYVLTRRVAR